MLILVVLGALALATITTAQKVCPWNCQCINNNVECKGDNLQLEYLLFAVPTTTQSLSLSSSNATQKLDMQYFQHMVQLKSLSLTNYIISEDIFSSLSTLYTLNLNGTVFPPNITKMFTNLFNLRTLKISNTRMPVLNFKMLQSQESLKVLHIVESDLKVVEEFSFYGTPNLVELNLSKNDIISLNDGAFLGLSQLRSLDLSYNRLLNLNTELFRPLRQLTRLSLKNNPFKVIFPHMFLYLNSTRVISLGYKNGPSFSVMKFSFRGLENLQNLALLNVNNGLLEEHTFYGLDSVKRLSIKGVIQTVGERAFLGLYSLKAMNLSQCKIQVLMKHSFEGLHKLESLDLSHNNLMALPDTIFSRKPSLKVLILNNNLFSALEKVMFDPVPRSIQSIQLAQNPWQCNCSLVEWIVPIKDLIPLELAPLCDNTDVSVYEFAEQCTNIV